MRAFFIDTPASLGETVALSAPDSKHLTKVLRATKGEQIKIVTGTGTFLANIVSTEPLVKAELVAELTDKSEADLEVYLLQGMAKGERMEIVIQKAVELGVTAIIPVACSRCVVQLKGEKAAAKIERWQKIADAAAKQCGRAKITKILPVSSLGEALKRLPENTFVLMPWEVASENEMGEDCSLKTALAVEPPKNVAIIIGPEGGLTQAEVETAQQVGARVVSLGKRILRTETAAIAVVTIVMYEWGDIGGQSRSCSAHSK